MKNKLSGREQEESLLKDIKNSKKAEFLAIYGRRRVGKTFLIRSFFEKESYYFEATGLKNGKLKEQLSIFNNVLSKTFYNGLKLELPANWMQAFEKLTQAIKEVKGKKSIILFFDELPWMANKRSLLLQALDHYWNTRWEKDPRIKLIVCGSAASWILDNIINNKGGLYNRLTRIIRLEPFSLKQTEVFLKAQKINLSRQQILNLYMLSGGIPHYLRQVKPGESAVQAINRLCFSSKGSLFDEFNKLFASLFNKHEIYEEIVRVIAGKRYGITRNELIASVKTASGGGISRRLKELEEAGFIASFIPFENKKEGIWYRLIDNYSWFYLYWIESLKNKSNISIQQNYWHLMHKRPEYNTWAGYAFELICLQHIEQIAKSLNFRDLIYHAGSYRAFRKNSNKKSITDFQIDLLFDREDNIITICEIKYSQKSFKIDRNLSAELKNRLLKFDQHLKSKSISKNQDKDLQICLISNQDLKPNTWSEGLVENILNLDSLFY